MSTASAPQVILASSSPRRRELLTQIGVRHRVVPADIDETLRSGEAPEDYVLRLAREKAERVWQQSSAAPRLPVLGADTAVVQDGIVFGKPAHRAAALAMLGRLSGRAHQVLSAVALVGEHGSDARLSLSTVRFRPLAPAECAAYWDSGEPRDKAGAYAIQGRGAEFIEYLAGSYSGVMGLPLFETAALLRAAGVLPGAQVAA
ncbi:MAG TPA: Maf family protein [Steroidobacteraceae bacterium]|nr:Maf family protein [Steroidobacteraceae bacterium]